MAFVSRSIEVLFGASFVYAGVLGLTNSTEYLGESIRDNDASKGREVSDSKITNIGRFAMDNATMAITGLDELGVPFVEASDANRSVMRTTATADVIGVTIGYGGSALVLATGLGLVGIGVTGRQVFDQSRKVNQQIHA